MQTLLRHVLLSLTLLVAVAEKVSANEVNDRIEEFTLDISSGGLDMIGDIRFGATQFVASLYALRKYEAIWLEDDRREDLLNELEDAERHGFAQKILASTDWPSCTR